MNISKLIDQLLLKGNGVLRTSDAEQAGISRTTLSQLVKNGALERVARGQYIRSDTLPDELFLLQQRSSKIVFSHETALFLHGMAERTPLNHSFTVPRGTKLKNPIFADCKIYHIKPDLHGLGRCTILSSMGHEVTAYNVERTVCDILRSRSRIDSQTFASAMKSYAARSNQDWNKLQEYADAFRVTKLLRQYLEVLT